jgi:hypothetical protein
MALPMMAPAATPPSTPAATAPPQPRQPASAEFGKAMVAAAMAAAARNAAHGFFMMSLRRPEMSPMLDCSERRQALARKMPARA